MHNHHPDMEICQLTVAGTSEDGKVGKYSFMQTLISVFSVLHCTIRKTVFAQGIWRTGSFSDLCIFAEPEKNVWLMKRSYGKGKAFCQCYCFFVRTEIS